uniref:PHD domain-containing protein n=1 Tax=Rhabditophanes sp. KR3021 TaxID=114890 RepID=A0AC35TQ80_9BILA
MAEVSTMKSPVSSAYYQESLLCREPIPGESMDEERQQSPPVTGNPVLPVSRSRNAKPASSLYYPRMTDEDKALRYTQLLQERTGDVVIYVSTAINDRVFGRTRPCSPKSKEIVVGENVNEETPRGSIKHGKVKRGRPKGAQNKRSKKEVVEGKTDGEISTDLPPSPVISKVGRKKRAATIVGESPQRKVTRASVLRSTFPTDSSNEYSEKKGRKRRSNTASNDSDLTTESSPKRKKQSSGKNSVDCLGDSCKKPDEANCFWVGCDGCNAWYHSICVYGKDLNPKSKPSYYCPDGCDQKTGD